ncbi:MAG: hypothetical protein KDA84_30550, partial [Planctomycetaceae bacterium]|nr:hypothetical protein [Planctomycetaceae bacterium]
VRARDSLRSELPLVADRPKVGTRVSGGQPVCSVLVAGETERGCRDALQLRLLELQSHFAMMGGRVSMPQLGD